MHPLLNLADTGVWSHRHRRIYEEYSKVFNLKQQQDGYRLACQTHILGNVVIFVPEESRMGKQVVRKAATNRPMKVNPAVRKYCVELPKATLDNNVGDWERLQAELSKNFNFNHLTIDYEVLLDLQNIVREGDWKVTVSVWQGKEIIKIEPGFVEKILWSGSGCGDLYGGGLSLRSHRWFGRHDGFDDESPGGVRRGCHVQNHVCHVEP
jgi:uncharacterized 2Fe-2S/4Fe-4S cluster protein (DUF4445 family)